MSTDPGVSREPHEQSAMAATAAMELAAMAVVMLAVMMIAMTAIATAVVEWCGNYGTMEVSKRLATFWNLFMPGNKEHLPSFI